jgi:hypothetical protein
MNYAFRQFLPADFSGNSRVWIYQSNRSFSLKEALEVKTRLNDFVESWNSHGAPVKGYANLFFGQFIVLMADERSIQVSGCSTDSSVRLIKQIENQFQVSLFDRLLLAFIIKEKVEMLPASQLANAAENGSIDENTLYFNNTVQTRDELEKNWLIPFHQSWLSQKIQFQANESLHREKDLQLKSSYPVKKE